jgi:hypothetical protein
MSQLSYRRVGLLFAIAVEFAAPSSKWKWRIRRASVPLDDLAAQPDHTQRRERFQVCLALLVFHSCDVDSSRTRSAAGRL